MTRGDEDRLRASLVTSFSSLDTSEHNCLSSSARAGGGAGPEAGGLDKAAIEGEVTSMTLTAISANWSNVVPSGEEPCEHWEGAFGEITREGKRHQSQDGLPEAVASAAAVAWACDLQAPHQ